MLLVLLATLSILLFIRHEYVMLLKDKNLADYSESHNGYDRHAALLRHKWFSKSFAKVSADIFSTKLLQGKKGSAFIDGDLNDTNVTDDDDSLKVKSKRNSNDSLKVKSKKNSNSLTIKNEQSKYHTKESSQQIFTNSIKPKLETISHNKITDLRKSSNENIANSISKTKSDSKNDRISSIINGKRSHARGKLICNKKPLDSEVIYWKDISSDKEYVSPIIPINDRHFEKYLSFAYDHGGWNNMR